MIFWYKHNMLGDLQAVKSFSPRTDPSFYVGLVTVVMFFIGLILLASVLREWRSKRKKLLSEWPKNCHSSRRAA